MTESTAAHSADHYVHTLDLGDDPFDSGFESDYFYSTPARNHLLDQLVHFSRYSDHVVVLVGAEGVGTSTVLDEAIRALRDAMDCCYMDAEVSMSPEQVLESLCEQLHLHLDMPVTADDFFSTLKKAIHADDAAEPILLAIDQAHFLSLEGYELLQTICDAAGDLFSLLLVGEYQVEQLVASAKFDKDNIKLIELEPLSRVEVGEYIQGLLQSVGYAGEQPLDVDQLSVLYDQSRGSFAEIKQLAPALLRAKVPGSKPVFNVGIPLTHIAAIGIIVVSLLFVWAYQGESEQGEKTVSVEKVLEFKQPIERSVVVAKDSAPALPNVKNGEIKREERSFLEDVKQQSKEAEVLVKNIPENVTAPPKDAKLVEKTIQIDTPAVNELEKPVVEERDRAPKASKIAEKSVSLKPYVSPKEKILASSRERRLLELDDSKYVLQLMGAVDEQRVQQFVKRYAGRLPITYYETVRKDRPWYVAIAGPYNDRASALSKAKELPSELQKLGPWAKNAESVKKAILAD